MIPLSEGSNAQEEDYSTTNIQVEGVDEADVVKTDGEYLYIVSTEEQQLYIVRTNNGNPMDGILVSLSMYDFAQAGDLSVRRLSGGVQRRFRKRRYDFILDL